MSEVSMREQSVTISIDQQATVSAQIAQPARFVPGETPGIVWAHGAGTDMHHPVISYFHAASARAGWLSVKFNFLYKELGRKAPDSNARLEHTFGQVLTFVRESEHMRPSHLFAAGKSMGGRIASQVVAAGQDVQGLIFLGYPLHPPNRFEKLRSEHLERIRCPMLFMEGTRDPFCRLDLLARVRERLSAPTELHVIEGANHDFRLPKKTGRNIDDVWSELAAVIHDTVTRWCT